MHIPVLLNEIRDNIKEGSRVVFDGTLGAGGHAKEILSCHESIEKYIGVDRDEEAIAFSKNTLKDFGDKVLYVCSVSSDIKNILKSHSIKEVDTIILDLGLSSRQLEESGRGFTFQKDEPLRMTMDGDKAVFDASDIVNTWDEEDIANVIYAYGEERFSRRIASAIVAYRKNKEIKTTFELSKIVDGAIPKIAKNPRINPATKTFQALRIAVNNELAAAEKTILDGYDVLSKDGRILVISFHSLEDRVVKLAMRKLATEKDAMLITKKPIIPKEEEVKSNPRSRSAKLRILQK